MVEKDKIVCKNASTQTYDEWSTELLCIHGIRMTNQSKQSKQLYNATLEYEELVLLRSPRDSQKQLLGITLCYGNYDYNGNGIVNCGTNIYVAGIEADSIADKDGRIRVGDQILQINGVSIHSRNDALNEFSKCSNQVRLLLARTRENEDDEDSENFGKPAQIKKPINDLNLNLKSLKTTNFEEKTTRESADSMYGEQRQQKLVKTVVIPMSLSPLLENDEACRLSIGEKATDSGMSRGTDSEEHDGLMQQNLSSYPFTSIKDQSAIESLSPQMSRLVLEDSLEQDLANLHRDMETIRLECDRLIRRHANTNIAQKQRIWGTYQEPNTIRPLFRKFEDFADDRFASTSHQEHKENTGTANQNEQKLNLHLRPVINFQQRQHSSNPRESRNNGYENQNQQRSDCNFSTQQKHRKEQQEIFAVNGIQLQQRLKDQRPPPSISSNGVFVEETSSSAYNTGGDSCRSTPMNYAENYNGNLMENFSHEAKIKNILKADLNNVNNNIMRPKNLTLFNLKQNVCGLQHCQNIQPITTTNLSSPENFYHTIDTPTPSTITAAATVLSPTNNSRDCKVKFRLPKISANFTPLKINYSKLADDKQRIITLSSATTSSTTKTIQNVTTMASTASSNRNSYRAGVTMYTSADKLAETIAYQQRLLREAMIDEARVLSEAAQVNTHPFPPIRNQNSNRTSQQHSPSRNYNRHSISANQAHTKMNENALNNDVQPQFEWKIKRRPDGTRYITRRPLRNQIMKMREEEVNRERFALSTDDDAVSELKIGRFWNRTERKRHLERARQRKIRHLKMLSEKSRNVLTANEKRLLQLTRAKQNRQNTKNFLDKFTTIQELLTHGIRGEQPNGERTIGGILSVTTV